MLGGDGRAGHDGRVGRVQSEQRGESLGATEFERCVQQVVVAHAPFAALHVKLCAAGAMNTRRQELVSVMHKQYTVTHVKTGVPSKDAQTKIPRI